MQRREPAVRAAREVRRDDVGVQLRIQRPAHPMHIGHRDQPLPRLDRRAVMAATHEHRALIQIRERGGHRVVVRAHQHARQLVRAGGGEDADRLRRRKRQIKRRDLRITSRPPQPHRRIARIHARDQRVELPILHPAREAERLRAGALPLARNLPAARVVVVGALCDLLLVIAVLAHRDLADRHHNHAKLAKRASLMQLCAQHRSLDRGD